MRRVAVTGLGMVAATGNNVADAWEATLGAKSGVDRIQLFDPKELTVQIAAEAKNFSADGVFDAKEIKRTSRFVQFAAVAAQEAMKDAGLYEESPADNRQDWGCSIGVGIGSLADIEENAHILRDRGQKRVSPFFMPYTIANMAAGVVSRLHLMKGPNLCTTTACTSGTHGVGEAFHLIKLGQADVMIAGGAESAICPLGIAAFAALKALSNNNDDPANASRPFDKDRDGFVMGEGAGLLILEEWDRAKARGAKIYAEVVGYGMSGDAYHITAPAPEGEGAQRCMKAALKSGGINVNEVDYINAHGTSTSLNDKFETQAIRKVFGASAETVSISSTKGVTGHCLGAAGGIEAVFTALAIDRGVIPPTAGLRTPDPDCDLDYTPLEPKERKIRCAVSNSFGFGGTNGSIVMRRV